MTDDPLTRTEGEGETLEMLEGFESFSPGQVLGERYQILEMLGRGEMGEVWHAFDLKLRVGTSARSDSVRIEFELFPDDFCPLGIDVGDWGASVIGKRVGTILDNTCASTIFVSY